MPCMARGCMGDDAIDLEGGRELRSGGAMSRNGCLREEY